MDEEIKELRTQIEQLKKEMLQAKQDIGQAKQDRGFDLNGMETRLVRLEKQGQSNKEVLDIAWWWIVWPITILILFRTNNK